MIKIRYADLPQGLHAHLDTGGRRPVIYLLPGLSPAQRRDALRRLVRTSRQGHGPRLRAAAVTFAVARDVAKTTGRNGLAAVRCHPAGSIVLGALITTAVVCYSLFVTVTVRFATPHQGVPPAAAGALSQAAGTGGSGRSQRGRASAPGTRPAVSVTRSGSPAVTATAGSGAGPGPSGPPASPGPVPSATWSGPGGVLPSASATPSSMSSTGPSTEPSPVPSAAPSPAPPPATTGPPPGRPGGLCLQLGPLGVCVSG